MAVTIALIAHDRKKDEMVELVKEYEPVLRRYRLIATEATGQRIQEATNLSVALKLGGSLGGDVQIANEVANGEVLTVIFLADPLYAQFHEPDLKGILRICNLHNVSLATNLTTARVLLTHLAKAQIAHLIFNPAAGQGNPEQELAIIQDMLSPHMHLEVHLTQPEDDPRQLAQAAIESHADLVIASGGDGTVSAVAGGLVGTGVPLGVIPRGTANAFAGALGISATLMPIRSACQTILTGQTRTIDAARCNGMPMILLAGIGFEAETIELANREAKDRWGVLAYLMAGWQQLEYHELFETEIELEDRTETFDASAITIANAAPFTSVLAQGMGEVICDDGFLNVTVTSTSNKIEAIRTIATLLGAALINTRTGDNIAHFTAKRIKVTTNPPQKVVVDGELIGTTPVEVECVPQGLTVMVPYQEEG